MTEPDADVKERRRWPRLYAAVLINLALQVLLLYIYTRAFD